MCSRRSWDTIVDSHDRCVAAQTVLAHESFIANAKDQGAAILGELQGIRQILAERVVLQ